MTHTPGPWQITDLWDHQTLTEKKDRNRVAISADSWLAFAQVVVNMEDDDPEQATIGRANANLISAAPDLLEALEMVLKYGVGYKESDKKAKEAIAKARGVTASGQKAASS